MELKAAREKQPATHKGTPTEPSAGAPRTDSAGPRLAARCTPSVERKSSQPKEYTLQQGHPSELREKKSFTDKQKLKDCITLNQSYRKC